MIKQNPFLEQVSQNADLLYLVRGSDEGEPAWHFLMLENRAKKALFLHDLNSKSINIKNYGKILASGWGESPPDNVTEEMKNNRLS